MDVEKIKETPLSKIKELRCRTQGSGLGGASEIGMMQL